MVIAGFLFSLMVSTTNPQNEDTEDEKLSTHKTNITLTEKADPRQDIKYST